MACGLPVVATSGGGVAELVDDRTGILAAPNSVDSLAGAIEGVYARKLAELGANARRKAAEYYDWNEILPQVMRRYQAVLGTRERDEPGTERICVTD
jgi:alpha-1,6-mannosyltransferase